MGAPLVRGADPTTGTRGSGVSATVRLRHCRTCVCLSAYGDGVQGRRGGARAKAMHSGSMGLALLTALTLPIINGNYAALGQFPTVVAVQSTVEKRNAALDTMVTHILLEWEAAKSPRLFPLMKGEL